MWHASKSLLDLSMTCRVSDNIPWWAISNRQTITTLLFLWNLNSLNLDKLKWGADGDNIKRCTRGQMWKWWGRYLASLNTEQFGYCKPCDLGRKQGHLRLMFSLFYAAKNIDPVIPTLHRQPTRVSTVEKWALCTISCHLQFFLVGLWIY